MLIKVLAPGYYARQDTATPVKIGIIAMVANMVMNLVFVLPLAKRDLSPAKDLVTLRRDSGQPLVGEAEGIDER